MFTATLSQIVAAILLISIIIPYFLAVAFCILICYSYAAYFYRASARELKVGLFHSFCRFSNDAEPYSAWMPSCGPHFILTFPSHYRA